MFSQNVAKALLIFLLTLPGWSLAQAQTPGGVTASPMIWFKANAGVSQGTGVSTWADQGSSFNAVQNTSTRQPGFLSESINFNPTIVMDGVDDYLAVQNISYNDVNEVENLVIFTVFKTDVFDVGRFDNWSFIDFDRSEYYNFYVRGDNGRMTFSWSTHDGTSSRTFDNDGNTDGLNDNRPHLGVAIFDANEVQDTKVRVDGREDYSIDRVANGVWLGTGNHTRYGFVGDGSEATTFNGSRNNHYHNGEIAEIIVFQDVAVSAADIEQVESYLAIKYGLSIEHNLTASNNSLLWDYTTNAAYNSNLLGIGRDDNSGLDQVKSINSNFDAALILDQGSSFGVDQTFLIAGSNGSAGLIDSNLPPGYYNRSSRVWRVEETGTTSNTTLSFLLSEMGIPNTGLVSDYALIYNDADADFTSGASVETNATLNGDTLTFTGIDLNSGYVSLAAFVIPPLGVHGNLAMWYRADTGVNTSGNSVTQWTDQSENPFSGIQSTSASQPTLLSESFNFHPSISFDGTDDYLAIEDINYSAAGEIENLVVFTVYKSDYRGCNGSDNWGFLDFDASDYFNFYVRGDDGRLGFSNTADNATSFNHYGQTRGLNDSRPHLGVAIYQNAETYDTKIRLDGRTDISIDATSNGTFIGRGADPRYGFIGANSEAFVFNGYRGNEADGYYRGDIAEIIYYQNQTPDSVDIEKIESYLAIKYGVSLQHNYLASNETLIWNYTTALAYSQNILGVGRDDISGLDQRKSMSSQVGATLVLEHPAAFNTDQNFLILGDNGLRGFTPSGGSFSNQSNKVWWADETGNVSGFTLKFLMEDLDLLNSGSASDYALAYNDADGNFNSGATLATSGTIDGDTLIFTGIDLNDGYFTLLSNTGAATTTLPQAQIQFDAGQGLTLSGNEVTQWNDQGLGTNHAVQSSAPNRPTVLPNEANFNPVVSFDGSTSYLAMQNQNLNASGVIQDMTVFTVFKTALTGCIHDNLSLLDFDRNEYFSFYMRGDGRLAYSNTNQNGQVQDNYGNSTGINDNRFHLGTASYDGNATLDTRIWVDGLLDLNQDRFQTGVYLGTGNSRYGFIGDASKADVFNGNRAEKYFQGEIAEVIYYQNQSLTDTDIQKIESYLGIKYGLSLNHDYVAFSGTVLWDVDAVPAYSQNIVGIGRDDQLNLYQGKSISSEANAALILEQTTAFSNDEEVLIAASNAQYGANYDISSVGFNYISNRVWRLDETGTVTNTRVAILLNRSGIPNSGQASDYSLLYNDADADFSAGFASASPSSINGDTLFFDGLDLNDGYMAIASNAPLPFGVTANMVMWLKGNEGLSLNANQVNTWEDQATQSHNGVQSNNSNRPTVVNNAINGNPSLSFDGSDDYLALENISYTQRGEIENLTVFTIFKTDFNTGSEHSNWAFLDFDRSENFNFYVRGDNGALGFSTMPGSGSLADNYGNITGLNDNQAHLGVAIYRGDSLIDTRLRVDGQEDVNQDNYGTGVYLGRGNSPRYGFVGDGSEATTFNGSRNNTHYDGEIAEIIYYQNDNLSNSEIQRIESYLAIKYGLTLNNDYQDCTGTVIWDINQDSQFNNNIVGIGRDDVSVLNQKQSQHANDILAIGLNSIASDNASNSGSFTSDRSFFMWGHNGEQASSTDLGNSPSGIQSRLDRVWLAQETGNVGAVRIQMNASDIEGPTGPGSNNLFHARLIVDADGDFTSGATIVTPTVFDNTTNLVEFDFDFEASSGFYFTLGSVNSVSTPLPIELLAFDAQVVEKSKVALTWSSAQEINFSHYEVERSPDGQAWEQLHVKQPVQDLNFPRAYQYLDLQPYSGVNYYRLKAVDLDDTFAYSNIVIASLELASLDVSVYPNPSQDVVHIQSSPEELSTLRVFSTQGQEVTGKLIWRELEEGHWQFDMRSLPLGTYALQTRTHRIQIQKK